ncbi:MAG: carbon starvation protein A [Nanoarchaeota archaeon]|nr:carbon starvation protein A [Nanoarchaeota archaeon]MBU1501430.1 carbon starvation protein A [Nanoarchaeota archaeon]
MGSVWILLAALAWFFVGYRFYSRFIEKRLKVSDKNKTPATSHKEDADYSPASKPFLIGHHFASIAGAGPIIGPILAILYFGWGPVVAWVLLGSVLIGAMHDYTSLMASVRNKGKSVSVIAKNYLSSKAGWVFGLMIWLTLVLVITVFSVSAADSIVDKPDLVIPLLTITVIAVVLGFGVKKYNWNYKYASIIAIILIFFSVWVGHNIPVSFGIENPVLLKNIWVTVIFGYALLASIAPVWILLRPRDYLSAIQMTLILVLGFVAILIARPAINAPIYISGSIFPIWPILFITVACGAISGFHGLVSSGTTSKQLAKESHGRAIGYGGMLLEGLLAILVTIVAISGLSWGIGEGTFQTALEKGWIVLFSTGFGNIVGNVIPFLTVGIAGLLGAFMVNQFILTSVDTSTRLGRFIISESLFPKLKNKFLTTMITLIPAWLLAITNSYETMWRLFGTSNQLIASITMISVSSYFVSRKIKVKFILIPALFVLATTLSALLYLTFRTGGYFGEGKYALVAISMIMFVLGLFVAKEGFGALIKRKA